MDLVEQMLNGMDAAEAVHLPRLSAVLREGMTELLETSRLTYTVLQSSPDFRRKVREELESMWRAGTAFSVNLLLSHFSEGFKAEKSTDLIEGVFRRFFEQHGQRTADQIISTTERQIRDLMAGGLSRGEAVEAVYASILERLPYLSDLRATIITRTGLHSVTQFASLQTALRSSIPLVKVWNAVSDERTRDFGELGRISQFNHRVMDGTRADLASPFLVPTVIGGVESLLYPGDPNGSAGNIINCRCVQTYERAR